MSVRPVLFVGCGGSGGATLQYVMDNLRTELRRILEAKRRVDGISVDLGTRGLPDAWQFVHVDVPSSPDTFNEVRPPIVPDQGGLYVGLAPKGLTYAQVDRSVWESAGTVRPDLMAGWLRRPGQGDPDLENGAGQERAVGRAATLNELGKLKGVLVAALGQLNSAHATGQLNELASVMGSSATNSPVVFIVSSMSGGSGASMVLDVAQVLALTKPNLAATTSMFLYTSEVFSSLDPASRRGVEPNGLAALGELIATSLGSNRTDGLLFDKLGVSGSDVARPFRRVFPIGNKHGRDQAMFGDGSQETIYRAVGRGLAGLVASPGALNDFVAYDVTNNNPTPTEPKWLGEGSKSGDAVQWGSFGFARLSLGRDRYGEYVSQRFARSAMDRLVSGHMRDETQAGEQQLRQVADDAYARLLRAMGLPFPSVPADVANLLGRGAGSQVQGVLGGQVREILGKELFGDANLSLPLPGERFVGLLRQLTAQRRGAVIAAAQQVSYAHVHAWQRQFIQDLVLQVEVLLARDGLAVTRQVMVKLKEDSLRWVNQLRGESHALAPQGTANMPEPPPQVLAPLQALPMVSPDHPLRQQLLSGYVATVTKLAAAATGSMLAEALADFAAGFADPMIYGLQMTQGQLAAERSRNAGNHTIAELRTYNYADWPAAQGRVPDRFAGADNEVLLMDVTAFPSQFEAHLGAVARNRGQSGSDTATLDGVLHDILRDRWMGHNDSTAVSSVILMTAPWVPAQLTVDPRDPASVRSRSVARFRFALSPAEILDRARAWVQRADGEYGGYLTQGLHGYVTDGLAAPEEFARRRMQLVAKFGEALQQALPLVQVDAAAYGVVHRGGTPHEQFKFSTLPFKECGSLDADLLEVLHRRSAPQETVGRFNNALSADAGAAHIDIFGAYAPMSPLAFPSLLKPLTEAWKSSVAMHDTEFFWTNRRARPLPGALPMSQAERRAYLGGYVVGKVTGRMRGSYAVGPESAESPIEVFDGGKRTWLRFPSPLLSPYMKDFAADEYAAILESQLLAIAACGYDSSLSPLEPYVAMRRLFGKVIQAPQEERHVDDEGRGYLTDTGTEYLRQWIVDGVKVPGSGPLGPERTAKRLGLELTGPQERQEATIAYLDSAKENRARVYRTDDPLRNPFLKHYDRRPLAASLAVDFVWALDAVTEIVQGISISGRNRDDNGDQVSFEDEM